MPMCYRCTTPPGEREGGEDGIRTRVFGYGLLFWLGHSAMGLSLG